MARAVQSVAFSLLLLGVSAPAFAQSASAPAANSSSSHSTTTAAKKTVSKKHHSRRQPTQKAPTPARISEIQSALSRRGYYPNDPSGKWDSATVAAMQKFQSDNGLESSGKIDALSLQKLGLGSSIAGVSAPRPVQPPPNKPAAPSTSPASAPVSAAAPASAQNSAAGSGSALASSSAASPADAKPQH